VVSHSVINYMPIAARIVRDSLAAIPGETAVVITDGSGCEEFVTSLEIELAAQSIEPMVVTVPRVDAKPHGYLTWNEPPTLFESICCSAEIVIVYMSTLVALSQAVQRARSTGTRFLFIPADYDMLRPATLEEDLNEMSRLGAALVERLSRAQRAVVTTAEGTHIEFGSIASPSYDDARARQSGDLDFYPGGMWNVIPNSTSVNGTVIFPATLYPIGSLTESIHVTFEEGKITAITGGWQARVWERWLRSFGDARIFEFSHLSGGLARAAETIGHDWEDLIRRGGILISGGENVLYGGQNAAHAHFDGAIPDATLRLDGEVVLDTGVYTLQVTKEADIVQRTGGEERAERLRSQV
jgi:hypothetical protein